MLRNFVVTLLQFSGSLGKIVTIARTNRVWHCSEMWGEVLPGKTRHTAILW
jgi:hypothetical protein